MVFEALGLPVRFVVREPLDPANVLDAHASDRANVKRCRTHLSAGAKALRGMTLCWALSVGLLLAWLVVAAPAARAGAVPGNVARYNLTDLGTLGGSTSRALAINEAGIVVGEAQPSGGAAAASRPFMWRDGKIKELHWAPGPQPPFFRNGAGMANAINRDGAVVGTVERNRAWDGQAEPEYRKLAGTWPTADQPGVSIRVDGEGSAPLCGEGAIDCAGNDINAAGTIVGTVEGKGAFVAHRASEAWSGTLLGGLEAGGSLTANAINDDGVIVGTARDGDGKQAAVVWSEGEARRLLPAGAVAGEANDISARRVVGTAGFGQGQRAFTVELRADHTPNAPVQLPSPADWAPCCSAATAINRDGVVVGWAQDAKGKRRAVVWRDGRPSDLTELTFGAQPGWTLEAATGINDRGDIVGYSVKYGKNGEREAERAFLLRPRPLVLIPGIAASRLVRKQTREIVWIAKRTLPGCIPDRRLLSPDSRLNPATDDIVAEDVLRTENPCGITAEIAAAVYTPLLRTLHLAGYQEYNVNGALERRTEAGCDEAQRKYGPNLFVFAYDFRHSHATSAQALAEYVRCIQRLYPGADVDVLAHSAGGLVARRYILDRPNDHHVGRVVTVGAPWLGAPKIMQTLYTGCFLPLVACGPELREVLQTMPSAHELIPSRAYLELVPPAQWPLGTIPKRGPWVPFDYARQVEELDRRFAATPGTNSREFHDVPGQDDWRADDPDVQYHQFYGLQNTDSTPGPVRRLQEVTCRDDSVLGAPLRLCTEAARTQLEIVAGDGTVPLHSLTRLGMGLDLNAPHARLYKCQGTPGISSWGADARVEHAKMVNDQETIDAITRLLQTGVFRGTSLCHEHLRQRATSEHDATGAPQSSWQLTLSGAHDVEFRDGAGHSTKPIAGDLPGEVPGATLLPVDERTTGAVLRVPGPGEEYRVDFRGGNAIRLELKSDEGTVASTRYLDLPLEDNQPAQIRLAGAAEGPLEATLRYDANEDGEVDTLVAPSAALSGDAAADDTAPTLAVCRRGSRFDVVAHDDQSGVPASWWSTDGRMFHRYLAPLDVDEADTLHVFAQDANANRTAMTTVAAAAVPRRPRISVSGGRVREGSGARFDVALDCPSDEPILVSYGTVDGTADGAADFTAAAGDLTIAPGTTSTSVAIDTGADTLDEDDETFGLVLGGARNADVAADVATMTIEDADPLPRVSIAGVKVDEADVAATAATLKLRLEEPSGRKVTVDYATQDDSASAGSDYTRTGGTVTFAPGQTEATVTVDVLGDRDGEDEERFLVRLTGAQNATIAEGAGTVTIADNDARPLPGACDSATIRFDGGGGTGAWETPTNWTGDRVPGPQDVVCIPAGPVQRVIVTYPVEIRSLESAEPLVLTGGESHHASGSVRMRLTDPDATNRLRADTSLEGFRVLEVTGTLSIEPSASFTWTSTTFLTGTGDVTIAPGASFTVRGGMCDPVSASQCRRLSGPRLVRNEGTIRFAAGFLGLDPDVELVNAGAIELGDTARVIGNARVVNAGEIRKPAGEGVARLQGDIRNRGRVAAESGRLDLQQVGAERQPGTFSVAAGATLDLSGDTWHLDAPTPVAGRGTFVAGGNAGTIELNGVNAVARTELWSGTLNINRDALLSGFSARDGTLGGTATLTVPEGVTFVWGDVTMAGSGTTLIPDGAALEMRGPNMGLVGSRAVVNAGTATMGTARLAATGGSFTNSGRLTIADDATIAGDAAFRFLNTGTVRRAAGAGVFELAGNLRNAGVLRVETGTLRAFMRGDAPAQTGSVSIAENATLELRDGDFRFAAPSSITGAGDLLVGNGARATLPAVTRPSKLTLNGLELIVPTGITLNALELMQGTIGGPGAITVRGSASLTGGRLTGGDLQLEAGANLSWRAGEMLGAGTTRIAPGASMSVTGSGTLGESRVIANQGTLELAPNAYVSANGGTLDNQGTLRLESGATFERAPSAPRPTVIANHGEVVKAGSGEARIAGDLRLDGRIDVRAGALRLRNIDGTAASGADAEVAAGAALELYTGALAWRDGRIGGQGTLRLRNQPAVVLPDVAVGVLDVEGDLTALRPITAGELRLTSGAIGGPGAVNVAPGGTATVSGGTLAADLRLAAGAALTWRAGEMLGSGTTEIAADAKLSVTGSTTLGENRVIANRGTIEFARGSHVWANGGTLDSAGTVSFDSGSVVERWYGAPRPTAVVNRGRMLKTGPGEARLTAELRLEGMIDVRDGALRLENTSDTAPATADVDLAAGAALEIYTGALHWANGRIDGPGVLRVRNQAAVTLPRSAAPGVLDIEGEVTTAGPLTLADLRLTSGALRGTGGVTIVPNGSFALTGGTLAAGDLELQAGSSLIWQSGQMQGAGRTRIAPGASAFVRSSGTVGAGRSIVNEGALSFGPNAYLWFNGAALENAGTLTLDRGASILPGPGLTGTVSNTGTLIKSAGSDVAQLGTQLRNLAELSINGGGITTGDFENGPGATVRLGLAGAAPNTGYAQLAVRGRAVLDGTLKLAPGDPFVPPAGSAYVAATFASRQGEFAKVQSTATATPFTVSYEPAQVVAVAGTAHGR